MPITDFMHRLGCKSTKKRGKEVWFHAPYRSDSTPSFCVNTEKNIFNDFGAGVGGDIFILAGLMIKDFMSTENGTVTPRTSWHKRGTSAR